MEDSTTPSEDENRQCPTCLFKFSTVVEKQMHLCDIPPVGAPYDKWPTCLSCGLKFDDATEHTCAPLDKTNFHCNNCGGSWDTIPNYHDCNDECIVENTVKLELELDNEDKAADAHGILYDKEDRPTALTCKFCDVVFTSTGALSDHHKCDAEDSKIADAIDCPECMKMFPEGSEGHNLILYRYKMCHECWQSKSKSILPDIENTIPMPEVKPPKEQLTGAELYKARKYKLHMIDQQLILRQLMGEVRLTSFLPKSCLADIGYKIDTQGLAILVCHESYEPVPLDSIPEIVPVTYVETTPEEDEK